MSFILFMTDGAQWNIMQININFKNILIHLLIQFDTDSEWLFGLKIKCVIALCQFLCNYSEETWVSKSLNFIFNDWETPVNDTKHIQKRLVPLQRSTARCLIVALEMISGNVWYLFESEYSGDQFSMLSTVASENCA